MILRTPSRFATVGLRQAKRRRAFTLLEIIIAIAIIGLLSALAIGGLNKTFDNAKIDVAQTFVETTLKLPLASYRMHMGDYPSTAEGLQALEGAPQGRGDRWRGPYIDGKLPLDPYGREYSYRYPGVKNKDRYDVWSKGLDGVDGTEDDIGNWPKAESTAK